MEMWITDRFCLRSVKCIDWKSKKLTIFAWTLSHWRKCYEFNIKLKRFLSINCSVFNKSVSQPLKDIEYFILIIYPLQDSGSKLCVCTSVLIRDRMPNVSNSVSGWTLDRIHDFEWVFGQMSKKFGPLRSFRFFWSSKHSIHSELCTQKFCKYHPDGPKEINVWFTLANSWVKKTNQFC